MNLDELQLETRLLRLKAVNRFNDEVDDLVRFIRTQAKSLSGAIGEVSPRDAWVALGREIADRFAGRELPPPPC